MSDPQIQLGSSWKGHQQSDRQGLLGSTKNKGSRCYSIFGENIRLMETEKTYSILSFNWKEENLLKKKLSFLDSMKKYEANAWLMEQKAFYKRCHSKLRKSELAHAQLLGNKDLVKRLTSKNMLSNYTTTFVDESEAAVKSIIQNRREGEKNKMPFRLSLDKDRLYPSTASRATLKADSKDESERATVNIRGSLSRGEGKPALVLSLESLDNPEQVEKQRKLPVDSRPPAGGDFPSRPSSTGQSHLQDPAIGRKSKGKFLKYIIYGDRSGEHPKKKRSRPRKNPPVPDSVQMDQALPTQIQINLRQEFLTSERVKYLEARIQSLSQPTYFQGHSSNRPWEKGTEGVVHAPGIRTQGAGRGPEEMGKQTGSKSITKNKRLFS
ncbi:uncharacterized protein [Odocoileus virginianus]|uniref:Uncharacterized protein isoform X1 n=1 Tax=Odocoileus virginianus TaxID=9874 RepID=A0ABM4J289_ODOVR